MKEHCASEIKIRNSLTNKYNSIVVKYNEEVLKNKENEIKLKLKSDEVEILRKDLSKIT